MALFNLMSRPIVTVDPETQVMAAIRIAASRRIHHLVVLQNEDVVGILCVCDLSGALPSGTVRDHMSAPVHMASVNDTVESAAEKMRTHGVGCLPVAAGGLLLGIVTADDLLREGVSLAAMGRRRCDCCESSIHVRSTKQDSDGALCLYCRERATEGEESSIETRGVG